MNYWISFWTIFFFVSLIIFTVLSLVISIGSFFNVLSLFKILTTQSDQKNESFPEENERFGKD